MKESKIESQVLYWLKTIGWETAHGAEFLPSKFGEVRQQFSQVTLQNKFTDAISTINPLPISALISVFQEIVHSLSGKTPERRNRYFHQLLVHGIESSFSDDNQRLVDCMANIIDFNDSQKNEWLAVHQFPVRNPRRHKPDIILFVNGLPLVVIKLVDPDDPKATIWSAFQQLQTYRTDIPPLFDYIELMVISDGTEARIGTLTDQKEWFKPWSTIGDQSVDASQKSGLQAILEAIFDPINFLTLLRDFIVFEYSDNEAPTKKMASDHQFYAVKAAIEETLRVAQIQSEQTLSDPKGMPIRHDDHQGDHKIGVFWHSQESDKSLTMAFYVGRLSREYSGKKPTIVILTEEEEQNHQLFTKFSNCRDLYTKPPIQVKTWKAFRRKLSAKSGGILFITIEKFFPSGKSDENPLLSDRHNIVVIAYELCRTQYDFIDGYAVDMRQALPNASFVGFTGMPAEQNDSNTRSVFGDHICTYDIQSSEAMD